MEALAKSGAMDSLGESRRELFENIEAVLDYGSSVQGDRLRGQSGLFDEMEGAADGVDFFRMRQFDEWSESELSDYEKEALGFYFKAHPLLKYGDTIRRIGALGIQELKDVPSETQVSIFGVISSVKSITTRANMEMAFVTMEDMSGSIEVVVFPSVYEQYSTYLDGKRVVVATGRLNGDKVIADRLLYPEEALKESHTGIHILLNDPVDEETLIRLRDLFIQNKGSCNIYIHTSELEGTRKAVKASTYLLVDPSEELFMQIEKENLAEKAWVT